MSQGRSSIEEQKKFFSENGYLIVEGFFDKATVAKAKAVIDEAWRSRTNPDNPLVIDAYLDDATKYGRRYFRTVDDDARSHPYKINDLHFVNETIRDIIIDKRLVTLLEGLLGATPVACGNLCFEHGSEQPAHFDTFFMPSRTTNMMAASWIALEQVSETNGPLFYYPGSHLIEPYRFSNGGIAAVDAEMSKAHQHIDDIVKRFDLKKTLFMPGPGDLLIWHAQLLHGGGAILNKGETRCSLVTHYFTTVDVGPENRIDIGDGRLYLRRPHQYVAVTTEEIERFIATLSTPEADRKAVPPDFDPVAYLTKHKDVMAARVDPFTHYVRYGRNEGRSW